MDIILMADVPKLGTVGDLVKVKDGYARNFLIPQKKAISASVKSKKRLEHEKRIAEAARKRAAEAARTVAQQIAQLSLQVEKRVGEQGKLYGSVSSMDVEEALRAHDVIVDRRKIKLGDPIKALGSYIVEMTLSGGVPASVKLEVVADESAPPMVDEEDFDEDFDLAPEGKEGEGEDMDSDAVDAEVVDAESKETELPEA